VSLVGISNTAPSRGGLLTIEAGRRRRKLSVGFRIGLLGCFSGDLGGRRMSAVAVDVTDRHRYLWR